MTGQDPLSVVWGKSRAGTSSHLLIAHLLDTAAVTELIWDRYLAPGVRRRIDACTTGRGRSLFVLLCGLHDVGKATPAFQVKDAGLKQRVQDAGLTWSPLMKPDGWHHTLAGARILNAALVAAGWDRRATEWLWPMVAGHHGRVPLLLTPKDPRAHGTGPWPAAQRAFVDRVLTDLNIDPRELADVGRPSRATQLALLGLIIMADWIASNDTHFTGIDDLATVSLATARQRAESAWAELELRGGWATSALAHDSASLVRQRFGLDAHPFQQDVMAAAEAMDAPGLLVIEAPMGEGKTEAALAAAEILARRFGADGIFVGMPTQATSDPMFTRVREWVAKIDAGAPVALLHGRSRFNREWAELRHRTRFQGVSDDDYGMSDDAYGLESAGSCCSPDGRAAAEWFMGHKRGLLSPIAIATVDQLLYAATRTRHVMLRHAGLAGRVVLLDEVHAHDVYMSQFLGEALRWLAQAQVPVILLSATLPPAQRAALVRAYVQGATTTRDVEPSLPATSGYPRTTVVSGPDARPVTVTSTSSRPAQTVRVDVLPEGTEFDPADLARAVVTTMSAGGRALVVCNTVDRAQTVYRQISMVFGPDTVLLHARLTAAARAERTVRLVSDLGPKADRPWRLVIVATQVAEQSFDVDVDVLFSDLAPIDLLLQRIGRMHRHNRPPGDRPESMQTPRVVVSGVRFDPDGPAFRRGSVKIYGEHLLLRAAALVHGADAGWSVPAQVPALVATGYGDEPLGPDHWQERMARAGADDADRAATRTNKAREFLLAGEDQLGRRDLAGLHERSTADPDGDEVAAVVRDGDESVEAVLVRKDARGYLTLSGRRMGPRGEGISDETVLEEVTGSVVRLPARPAITEAAKASLTPLSGWALDPWLGRTRALEIGNEPVELGGHHLTYDDDLGLVVERTR